MKVVKQLKSVRELVIEYYPTAAPIAVKNHYEIITAAGQYLGQGKTASQAWKAAYNNNVR